MSRLKKHISGDIQFVGCSSCYDLVRIGALVDFGHVTTRIDDILHHREMLFHGSDSELHPRS